MSTTQRAHRGNQTLRFWSISESGVNVETTMIKFISPFIFFLVIFFSTTSVVAADAYVTGTMNNISSTPEGLLIMVDAGAPTNCNGTPFGWMLIPQVNKTMTATALAMWLSGQRNATIYTNSYSGTGFCIVSQFDPN